MTTPATPSSLGSVVRSLNAAFSQLQQLGTEPEVSQDPNEPPAAPPQMTADDRLQLTLFADEVDDVVRRVAALQIRLERL